LINLRNWVIVDKKFLNIYDIIYLFLLFSVVKNILIVDEKTLTYLNQNLNVYCSDFSIF